MGRKSKRERASESPRRESLSSSGPRLRAHDRSTLLAVCGCLFLAVMFVFGQTLRHEFINFDDDVYVYQNALVTGGLTSSGIVAAFTCHLADNWHPLTWLSHMLDWQLYGGWAGGHHAGNVLLHAATSVLLFLALRRMTGALWPSAFVAALFAVHPPARRVGSVGGGTERCAQWLLFRADIGRLRPLCGEAPPRGPVSVPSWPAMPSGSWPNRCW